MNSPSPLEQLTAFALCFMTGVVSTLALAVYAKAIKAKGASSHSAKG